MDSHSDINSDHSDYRADPRVWQLAAKVEYLVPVSPYNVGVHFYGYIITSKFESHYINSHEHDRLYKHTIVYQHVRLY